MPTLPFLFSPFISRKHPCSFLLCISHSMVSNRASCQSPFQLCRQSLCLTSAPALIAYSDEARRLIRQFTNHFRYALACEKQCCRRERLYQHWSTESESSSMIQILPSIMHRHMWSGHSHHKYSRIGPQAAFRLHTPFPRNYLAPLPTTPAQ